MYQRKVTDELFLQRYQVEQVVHQAKPLPKNHIWIYDRSGSMTHLLPELSQDLVRHAKTLNPGDYLTLAWFSGEGHYNIILKGYRVLGDNDISAVQDIIRKNSTSLNTTCFSEVLEAANQAISDLEGFNPVFELMFFTDGYPVVSNYNKEINAIFDVLDKLGPRLANVLMVGYGQYYNRDLLYKMAEAIGGVMIHSAHLDIFDREMATFIGSASAQKVEIDLASADSEIYAAFVIKDRQVVLCPFKDRKTVIPNSINEVFVLAKAPSTLLSAWDGNSNTSLDDVFYASALVLSQNGRSDLALTVLGKLGDVALIDGLNNAWTNDEFGKAENAIKACVETPSMRYSKGKALGYLPDPDAFCLLDLLETLIASDDAVFYPFSPAFHYKRIGAKTKAADGCPEFVHEENPACNLSGLVWNQERLNLSILAKIKGYIELDADHEKYGFAKRYPTYVWRNYTVIKDGLPNVDTLPVMLNAGQITYLLGKGLAVHEVDGINLLDLTGLPVINKAISDYLPTAKDLAFDVFEDLRYGGQLKVWKAIKDLISPDEKPVGEMLTKEQEEYLEKHCIGKNGFAPKVEKEEPTDFYMAYTFKIKAAGLSSFPSLNELRQKQADSKVSTIALQIMDGAYQVFARKFGEPIKDSNDPKQLAWLNESIAGYKTLQGQVRADIARAKFAVILAKRWFPEFSSREENQLILSTDYGDVKFTFELKQVKVEY